MMEQPAIFIVEDEAIVANDIKETLKSLGYTVTGIAKSGELALEKIKETKPDLVLMDIHLAGQMDGVETAGKIHVLYNIPVIYLTAYADKALLDRAKVTEPYGYVIKPYDERELHSVIEMALYKHRIEREIKKRDAVLFAVSSAVEWLLRISRANASPHEPRDFQYLGYPGYPRTYRARAGCRCNRNLQDRPGSDGTETLSLIYEWGCPSYRLLPLQTGTETVHAMPGFGLSRWQDLLMKGEVISATLSVFRKMRNSCSPCSVSNPVSILPIFIQDNLWGFIGFFDLAERTRSPDEVEALRITANLLGAAMGYR